MMRYPTKSSRRPTNRALATGTVALVPVGLAVLVSSGFAAATGGTLDTIARTERSVSTVATPDPAVVPPQCPTRDAVSFEEGAAVCPTAAGWRVRELVRRSGLGSDPSAPLGVYCWFRAVGDGRPAFASLPRTAKPDCPVLTPMAPASTSALPALRTAAMAGAAQAVPSGTGDVQVAVLDTTPNSYDSLPDDSSPHGRAVARVIASLACPNPAACTKQIQNRLALSYRMTSFEPLVVISDEVHGGQFGTVTELAGSVAAVLDDLANAPISRHQIINLSLGWDPESKGQVPPDAAAALKLVLERAACLGALTIAAAGNGTRRGPVSPADFEALPAPEPAVCDRLSFSRPGTASTERPGIAAAPVSAGGYRPLIYSVSATDSTDRPLATARPNSLPRLVAYGMDVAANFTVPGSATPPALSGTSMAAAIASAAAMAVWTVDSSLEAHEVMAMIYDHGVTLSAGSPQMDGRTVEKCLAGPTPCSLLPLRRVSVCQALAAATSAANLAAGSALPLPVCTTVGAHQGTPVGRSSPSPQMFISPPQTHPPRTCEGSTCPHRRPRIWDALRPWTWPQPGPVTCTVCSLKPLAPGQAWVYLSGLAVADLSRIPSTWTGMDLVVRPFQNGAPLDERVITFGAIGNQNLGDWLPTTIQGNPATATSASAYFELIDGSGQAHSLTEFPIDIVP